MPRPSDARNRGVVLVMVLVLLLALTGLVLSSLSSSSKGALETASLLPEYQADILAESALPMAINMLGQDMDPTSDTLQEPWAKPYRSDNLTILITPANAYLPVNAIGPLPETNSTNTNSTLSIDSSFSKSKDSLRSSSSLTSSLTPTQKEAAKEQDATKADTKADKSRYRLEFTMQRLLARNPDNLAMVENVRDWLHNSTYAQTKMPLYALKQPSYIPRFKGFVRPEEMLLVSGWENVSPAFVRTHFTVWNSDGRLNVNFAPIEVLLAYVPELSRHMDSILFWREQRGFTHISQLLAATTLASDGEEYRAALECLTVLSSTFQVDVEAKASGCLIRKRYILERNPLRPEIPMKVVAQDTLETRLDQR